MPPLQQSESCTSVFGRGGRRPSLTDGNASREEKLLPSEHQIEDGLPQQSPIEEIDCTSQTIAETELVTPGGRSRFWETSFPRFFVLFIETLFFAFLAYSLVMVLLSKSVLRYASRTALAGVAAAGAQGLIVLCEYRANPRGALVVPGGQTFGVETHGAQTSSRPPIGAKIREVINRQREAFRLHKDAIIEETKKMHNIRNISRRLILSKPPSTTRVANVEDSVSDADVENASVHNDQRKTYKIVVIGDSLACGVGCINVWDKPPEEGSPQQLQDDSQGGPVFPRFFANAISKRKHSSPVVWRSAGVVGGDVDDIHRECMKVIQEEADLGHHPDFVVILCGMNDMKKILSDPFRANSALVFREKLGKLVREIREHAPDTNVVLPALPLVPSINKDCKFNAFPLVLFLDAFLNYWDWQKHYIAEEFPSNVTFIGRPAKEDYEKNSSVIPEKERSSLTAADGVHPNANGYSVWATFLGNALLLDTPEILEDGIAAAEQMQ